jgi:hypothetical protein
MKRVITLVIYLILTMSVNGYEGIKPLKIREINLDINKYYNNETYMYRNNIVYRGNWLRVNDKEYNLVLNGKGVFDKSGENRTYGKEKITFVNIDNNEITIKNLNGIKRLEKSVNDRVFKYIDGNDYGDIVISYDGEKMKYSDEYHIKYIEDEKIADISIEVEHGKRLYTKGLRAELISKNKIAIVVENKQGNYKVCVKNIFKNTRDIKVDEEDMLLVKEQAKFIGLKDGEYAYILSGELYISGVKYMDLESKDIEVKNISGDIYVRDGIKLYKNKIKIFEEHGIELESYIIFENLYVRSDNKILKISGNEVNKLGDIKGKEFYSYDRDVFSVELISGKLKIYKYEVENAKPRLVVSKIKDNQIGKFIIVGEALDEENSEVVASVNGVIKTRKVTKENPQFIFEHEYSELNNNVGDIRIRADDNLNWQTEESANEYVDNNIYEFKNYKNLNILKWGNKLSELEIIGKDYKKGKRIILNSDCTYKVYELANPNKILNGEISKEFLGFDKYMYLYDDNIGIFKNNNMYVYSLSEKRILYSHMVLDYKKCMIRENNDLVFIYKDKVEVLKENFRMSYYVGEIVSSGIYDYNRIYIMTKHKRGKNTDYRSNIINERNVLKTKTIKDIDNYIGRRVLKFFEGINNDGFILLCEEDRHDKWIRILVYDIKKDETITFNKIYGRDIDYEDFKYIKDYGYLTIGWDIGSKYSNENIYSLIKFDFKKLRYEYIYNNKSNEKMKIRDAGSFVALEVDKEDSIRLEVLDGINKKLAGIIEETSSYIDLEKKDKILVVNNKGAKELVYGNESPEIKKIEYIKNTIIGVGGEYTVNIEVLDKNNNPVNIIAELGGVIKENKLDYGEGIARFKWKAEEVGEGIYKKFKIRINDNIGFDDGDMNKGVIEKNYEIDLRIDLVKPSRPKIILSEESWTKNSVNLIIKKEKNEVEEVFYRINEGRWEKYKENMILSKSGMWKIEAKLEDSAGNKSVDLKYAYIDKEKPIIENFNINNIYGNYISKEFNYEINAIDNLSGIKRKKFMLKNTLTDVLVEKEEMENSFEYEVYVVVEDIVGNVNNRFIGSYIVDEEAPKMKKTKVTEGIEKEIFIEAEDEGSGLKNVFYDIGSGWQEYKGSIEINSNEIYGSVEMNIKVVDNVNNFEITKHNLLINRVPQISLKNDIGRLIVGENNRIYIEINDNEAKYMVYIDEREFGQIKKDNKGYYIEFDDQYIEKMNIDERYKRKVKISDGKEYSNEIDLDLIRINSKPKINIKNPKNNIIVYDNYIKLEVSVADNDDKEFKNIRVSLFVYDKNIIRNMKIEEAIFEEDIINSFEIGNNIIRVEAYDGFDRVKKELIIKKHKNFETSKDSYFLGLYDNEKSNSYIDYIKSKFENDRVYIGTKKQRETLLMDIFGIFKTNDFKCIEVGKSILINSINIEDKENDLINRRGINRKYELSYMPMQYENNSKNKFFEEKGIDDEIKYLVKYPGMYKLRVSEKDIIKNSYGKDYSKEASNELIFYSHRRPKVELTYKELEDSKVEITTDAYDLDYKSRSDKGISWESLEIKVLDYKNLIVSDWKVCNNIIELDSKYKYLIRFRARDYGVFIDKEDDYVLEGEKLIEINKINNVPIVDFDYILKTGENSKGIVYKGNIAHEEVKFKNKTIFKDIFKEGKRKILWEYSEDEFNKGIKLGENTNTLKCTNKYGISGEKTKILNVKEVVIKNLNVNKIYEMGESVKFDIQVDDNLDYKIYINEKNIESLKVENYVIDDIDYTIKVFSRRTGEVLHEEQYKIKVKTYPKVKIIIDNKEENISINKNDDFDLKVRTNKYVDEIFLRFNKDVKIEEIIYKKDKWYKYKEGKYLVMDFDIESFKIEARAIAKNKRDKAYDYTIVNINQFDFYKFEIEKALNYPYGKFFSLPLGKKVNFRFYSRGFYKRNEAAYVNVKYGGCNRYDNAEHDLKGHNFERIEISKKYDGKDYQVWEGAYFIPYDSLFKNKNGELINNKVNVIYDIEILNFKEEVNQTWKNIFGDNVIIYDINNNLLDKYKPIILE